MMHFQRPFSAAVVGASLLCFCGAGCEHGGSDGGLGRDAKSGNVTRVRASEWLLTPRNRHPVQKCSNWPLPVKELRYLKEIKPRSRRC